MKSTISTDDLFPFLLYVALVVTLVMTIVTGSPS